MPRDKDGSSNQCLCLLQREEVKKESLETVLIVLHYIYNWTCIDQDMQQQQQQIDDLL